MNFKILLLQSRFCHLSSLLFAQIVVFSEHLSLLIVKPITSSSYMYFLTKEREVELKKREKNCKNKLNRDEKLIGHYMNMCQSFGHGYLKPFSIKGRVFQL